MIASAPLQPPQRRVVFRNRDSGLVLDASQGVVKLQPFSQSPSQLWILESVGDGKFFIISLLNGCALDIQGAPDHSPDVVIYPRNGTINQQWFINADKTISSAVISDCGDDLVLDVSEGDTVAGKKIIIYGKHGGENQIFDVQMNVGF